MRGSIGDLEELTEDIGEEVHKDHDQLFRIEQGKGEVLTDGKTTE